MRDVQGSNKCPLCLAYVLTLLLAIRWARRPLWERIQGATYLPMNPGAEAQGKALTQIIGQFNMKQTTVIIENSQYADPFLSGVRQVVQVRKQDIFNVLALDSNIGTNVLRQKLIDLSTKGWKVIVLHCSPELMLRVVTVAMSTRLYNSGYAWFLSEMAFSRDTDIIAQLPDGLLAIDSFWLGGVEDVVATALDYVMSATICVLKEELTTSDQQVPYSSEQQPTIQDGGDMEDQPTPVTYLGNATDFPYYFQRCLRNLINFCDNSSNASSNATGAGDEAAVDDCIPRDNFDVFLDTSARNKGPAFYLLNTVDDGLGDRIWTKVGYITASGKRDLKTVLWPGHNIYGPSSDMVKTYRVVTRSAEPFVFINSQASRKEECHAQVPCLQIVNSSQSLLTTVVDDFQSDMKYLDDLYTVHCCKGLALEMLETLAVDLNFRYVVYFVNDTNYGTLVNNNWTGMVGDVISGAADIIAGAFSVTSERMKVMDFTEPFLQNKMSMVSAEGGSNVSIWAFLSPFSGQVWLCIFLSSIVAGVATSFLEWHSPFGLNPKGRKRTKNYGLGSGLLMVMVLLTGHTINVKAPKSWPGKVIQNVWAGLAIFIMTSYTANLAAHLAGQSAVTSVKNVYDSDLLSKRIALIPSSAVESFVEKTNPKLSKRAKMSYVDSTITAINMLRDHTIDIYLDDTQLLEYGLARYDKDCKIRLAGPGKEFGSEGYAFGLQRHSWLKIPISNQILWYTESGYIQELAKKYLSRPQCEHLLSGSAHPYGLEHTGGLFIIMLSAVFISILFLILEHVAYSYLVPWLRKQPADTFWKTESLAFISQRVFRVVRSEKLYSQKQAAQEMITIVKQRDFTRLIQKHELQKRRQATQKRVKTKAEVFQDITANIISYHRQLQSVTDTAENSFDETECEDVNSRVNDNLQPSSKNIVFSAVNSDVPFDRYLKKGDMQLGNHKSGTDEDVYMLNSGGFVFPGNNTGGKGYRERATRSWVMPDKLGDLSLPRKGSESYLVPPETGICNVDTNYRRSWSGVNHNRKNNQPTHIHDIDNIMQRSPASTFYYENDVNDNKHSPECCIVSMTTPSPHHEYPPPIQGNLYYYSSTSSSIQSPNDEQREFSPFSSITSANTDEFSGDDQSSEGMSTISPDCSNSLASLASQLQDSDFQNVDSMENGSQTSADPLILNQTSPTELAINPLSVQGSNPNRMSHPSSVYDLPRRQPHHKLKVSPKKKLSRSRSSESFSRRISKKHKTRTAHGSSMPKSGIKISPGDFVNAGDNSSDGEMWLSEGSAKNHVAPLEGSGKISKTALKKSSGLNPGKNIHQQNQQPNNARRTRSYDSSRTNYFTPNLRIKDNRVKSTLRRHAMSGQQNQLSADFIDEYTLDALSKEDVLILWKKSEIELENRLQEVLARNRRLGLAIDYLARQDRSADAEEV